MNGAGEGTQRAYFGALTVRAGLPTTVALTALVGLTLGSFGPVAAYLTGIFPAPIRATGFGVGYSLALALPAFYVFYLAALGDVGPPHVAPVVVFAVGGVLIGLGVPGTGDTRRGDDPNRVRVGMLPLP